MQNADENTGRHFIEEFPNILSEVQTGMFDRCCRHEDTVISRARRQDAEPMICRRNPVSCRLLFFKHELDFANF